MSLDLPIDSKGTTFLILAVKSGMIEVINFMLRRQADLNKRDEDGNTPLHHAFALGFEGCIEVLIESGANENIENNAG